LAVSLFTLFSMTKIWANAFWGPAEPFHDAPPPPRPLANGLMAGGTAILVVASMVVAFFGGPLYDFSEKAASDLIDPAPYVEAVLDP
jgi:multicomponent Na+:H+ antiporter subunit D